MRPNMRKHKATNGHTGATAPRATRKKVVDTAPAAAVISGMDSAPAAPVGDTVISPAETTTDLIGAQQEQLNMETLVKDNKARKGNGKSAVYHIEGVRGSVKISSTVFDGDAPQTLEVNIPNLASGPKPKETPEARKARLAALPKKTAAEKLIALEAKVARARAKLAGASL